MVGPHREKAATAAGSVWKRNSFLKRNPALTRRGFRRHYAEVHGPLAASQAGFRRHTLRYVQNHVEAGEDDETLFDGITMTTQVPRADYTRGFFHEPDYANVKPDELYLFDIDRTVSVLGEVIVSPTVAPQGYKAVLLSGAGWSPPAHLCIEGASQLSASRLDVSNASALGFSGAVFVHPYMVEAWFAAAEDRDRAVDSPELLLGAGSIGLPVTEILIFGPERPWPAFVS
ncbi:EthD domain-containing protein [Mesorhizobium sp. KR9-304]|uniref:EthD domain-containing protein n=1 Tax=Mesorhizobium sp. KR9-304 TaxID=3156614 RepID=UPI0032B608F5